VLEYLWKAAWCFHDDADPDAEPWVATHALKLLAGEADAVITALHQQAAQQAAAAGLTATQRGGVDTCISYLTAKKPFLAYDTALAGRGGRSHGRVAGRRTGPTAGW
jgi:hypothetical protein